MAEGKRRVIEHFDKMKEWLAQPGKPSSAETIMEEAQRAVDKISEVMGLNEEYFWVQGYIAALTAHPEQQTQVEETWVGRTDWLPRTNGKYLCKVLYIGHRGDQDTKEETVQFVDGRWLLNLPATSEVIAWLRSDQ